MPVRASFGGQLGCFVICSTDLISGFACLILFLILLDFITRLQKRRLIGLTQSRARNRKCSVGQKFPTQRTQVLTAHHSPTHLLSSYRVDFRENPKTLNQSPHSFGLCAPHTQFVLLYRCVFPSGRRNEETTNEEKTRAQPLSA